MRKQKIEIFAHILDEPLVGFKGDLTPLHLVLGKEFKIATEGAKQEYLP